MANSPNFIAKQGVRVSTTGTLEYTPREDAKLYHAYCKGSTGAAEATLEVSSSEEDTINPITIETSYKWASYGLVSDAESTNVHEAFGHLVYEDLNTVDITLPGTFPLTADTTYVISLNLGNTAVNLQSGGSSGETIDVIAYRIYRAIYQTYLNDKNWVNDALNFTYTRSGSQQVRSSNLSLRGTGIFSSIGAYLQPNEKPSYITTAVSGNTVTISQSTVSIAGKTIPEANGYGYLNEGNGQVYDTSGTELVDIFGWNRGRTLNAVDATYSEFNGEVGSVSDPFKLFSDAKSQLEGLIVDGAVLEGTQKNATITNIKAVTTSGTLPIVSDHTFTGAGQDIDLISDLSTNPVFLTDVHGNKYLPLEKGQKIKITAPADNIVLVYGEE